ncbi:hypothetical protein BD779DRAFT_1678180 [Infundibulicybe gibba]|nr:hypothetical protein BD779DRAFT_1678180 [Infundibulicybe gibba]
MMKRHPPYLGAFLLKDENKGSDVTTDINWVHLVSVFAQITSMFTTTGRDDDKEEGLTVFLYLHRQINNGFVHPGTHVPIVSVFKDITLLNPLFRDQITNINQVTPNVFDKPDKLADSAVAVLTGEALLILKELINAQSQSKPSRDGINEWGMELDGKDKRVKKFKERAATLKMPEPVRRVFNKEISKLAAYVGYEKLSRRSRESAQRALWCSSMESTKSAGATTATSRHVFYPLYFFMADFSSSMDVPVALSRVLLVCTANNPDMIPALLPDRTEVLGVSS